MGWWMGGGCVGDAVISKRCVDIICVNNVCTHWPLTRVRMCSSALHHMQARTRLHTHILIHCYTHPQIYIYTQKHAHAFILFYTYTHKTHMLQDTATGYAHTAPSTVSEIEAIASSAGSPGLTLPQHLRPLPRARPPPPQPIVLPPSPQPIVLPPPPQPIVLPPSPQRAPMARPPRTLVATKTLLLLLPQQLPLLLPQPCDSSSALGMCPRR